MKNRNNRVSASAALVTLLMVAFPVMSWGAPGSASGGDNVNDIEEGGIPYRVHVCTF